jgi:hypothetical protein
VFDVKTRMFFDLLKVTNAADRAKKRVFSRIGAFVRTRARSLIRRRKRSARAGQAPTNRTGLLKRFIYFGWDPTQESVVVGPKYLGTRKRSGMTVPELLEVGGAVDARWNPGKTAHYDPHPFMGPALEKEREAGKIEGFWSNAIVE